MLGARCPLLAEDEHGSVRVSWRTRWPSTHWMRCAIRRWRSGRFWRWRCGWGCGWRGRSVRVADREVRRVGTLASCRGALRW